MIDNIQRKFGRRTNNNEWRCEHTMFFPPFRNTFFPPIMKRGRSDLLPPAKFPIDPFRGLLIDECVCRLVCTFYRFTYFLYDTRYPVSRPSPFFPPFLDDGRSTDNCAKSRARSSTDRQFCQITNHWHARVDHSNMNHDHYVEPSAAIDRSIHIYHQQVQ